MKPLTLALRGLTFRAWELADHGGPLVVCLHGFLDHGLAFAEVAAHAPHGRWVALDQRGFGGSAWSPPGSWPHFPELVADAAAAIRVLGGPCVLVGHSMGGTVAAMVAGALPALVSHLVLVEGLGAPPDALSPVARLRAWLEGLEARPHVPVLQDVDDAAARLRKRHPGLSAAFARLLAEHGTTPLPDGRVTWSFDPAHLLKSPIGFREEAFASTLAAIAAPTLAVRASDSLWPSTVWDARLAAVQAPLTRRELQGGHMLVYDAPAALADAIAEFVTTSAG